MALTTAQQTELDGLTASLFQLRNGRMPSRVVYQGRETDFAKIDLGDLKARIQELEDKAASPVANPVRRGALRFRVS